MGRTIIAEVSESHRTIFPEEERCAWKCPCGGTVPDTPRWCEYRKERERGHFCTDAVVCGHFCSDSKDCDSFLQFKKLIKEQQLIDVRNAPVKKKED